MQQNKQLSKSLNLFIFITFLIVVIIFTTQREGSHFLFNNWTPQSTRNQIRMLSLKASTVSNRGLTRQKSHDLLNTASIFMRKNNFSCPKAELLTLDSIFSYSISCKGPRHALDIVFFNGQQVKSLFDLDNKEPHIPLYLKLKINRWREFTVLMNTTIKEGGTKMKSLGFHVHNELTFGDLLILFYKEFLHRNRKQFKHSKKVLQNKWLFNMTEAEMDSIMDDGQPPIIITNTADENWGFLSTGP